MVVDPKGALNAHDAGAKDGSSPWPTVHQEGNTLRLGDARHLDQRPRQFGRSAFAPFSPSSACHQLVFSGSSMELCEGHGLWRRGPGGNMGA